ncbi:hypothetical protein QF000_005757 [Paraburkholderia atlantica]
MSLQVSPTDDAGGDFHGRLVYDCEAFEPDAQAPKVVQPREGVLDDAPELADPTSVRFAPTGDLRSNAGSMQWPAIFVVVVSAIGLHEDGLRQLLSPLATNGRDGFNQTLQLRDVVAVGACEDQCGPDALCFGDEVAL